MCSLLYYGTPRQSPLRSEKRGRKEGLEMSISYQKNAQIRLRTAEESDFVPSMEIIEDARAYLASQGSDQWQDGYPDETVIRSDIQKQKGFILEWSEGGQPVIAGYLCLDFDGEPAYERIKGAWLTGGYGKYAVIHRLAIRSEMRDQRLAARALSAAEEICREHGVSSIRIDTQENNGKMKRLLEKTGYAYCGTILFQNGPKIAFEKLL